MNSIQQSISFEDEINPSLIEPEMWHGSFNGRESSLHQLSPYVGKLKSGMVHVLLRAFSKKGDIVLDPFCGSGVVPLESLLIGRRAWANDLSPYAYVLTLGKLIAPISENKGILEADKLCRYVENKKLEFNISKVPEWVKDFFHPDTLHEVVSAFSYCRRYRRYFLMACLCGILHHVRPGFLSYPASHVTPYLRKKKYPPDKHPEMYLYRDLKTRIFSKVKRMLKRTMIEEPWSSDDYDVHRENAMNLSFPDSSVDLVLTSPPYYGALDYARDNRLRLWFLGEHNWRSLDKLLTASESVYIKQMAVAIKEIFRILKSGRHCIFILGDVNRDRKHYKTAEEVSRLAEEVTDGKFALENIYEDKIPDERRSRRYTKTTKVEKIVVLRKK